MRVLRTVSELRKWRALHKTVGFVPTMGALHNGHLGLIRQSFKDNQATVVSIFVNPSQFSPSEDLDKYPRSVDSDLAKISKTLIDFPGKDAVVFQPTVSEMYPSGINLDRSKQIGTFVEVLGCSHQLEGAVRPHFFRGVATVVSKLFNAVQPTKAYFGQKDIQQTVVIRRMVKDLLLPIEIVIGPTIREPSGLALSSRNVYLDDHVKSEAAVLFDALSAGEAFWKNHNKKVNSSEICDLVKSRLRLSPVVKHVEYVSVNNLDMLEQEEIALPGHVLSAAIVLKSDIRILDNVILS